MPTPAELDQLNALIKRLLPLTTLASGDLIRSQDWNVIVSALVEVARTVIADGEGQPVPPHQHGGQVTLEWLTPALRTTVEDGPLSDPFESGRLSQAETSIHDLGGQLEGLSKELNQLRLRVSQLAGNDATRESQVSSMALKVAATDSIRDDNLALRKSLDGIQANVNTALSVGQKLTVDGSPVDMQAVSNRVKSLETFRESMKTTAGNLLDAASIDAAITTKTAPLVTKSDLDTAFTQHPVTIPAAQVASLTSTISDSVKGDVTSTMNQLAATIKAQTDTSLATIDAKVARAVSDALPTLSDSIIAKVQPQIAAAVQGGVTQMQSAFTKQLGDATTTLRSEMAKNVADLQTQFGANLRDQVQKQVQVSLDPIQKSLSSLTATVQANGVSIAKQDTTLGQLGQRVEAVAQADQTARDQLKASITDEINGQTTLLQAKIDSRFSIADAATKQALADGLKTVNDRIDKISPAPRPTLTPGRPQ
jgi:hypothetical protein